MRISPVGLNVELLMMDIGLRLVRVLGIRMFVGRWGGFLMVFLKVLICSTGGSLVLLSQGVASHRRTVGMST